jgi:zinc D-Ala-D-Ala carboxypeptidase
MGRYPGFFFLLAAFGSTLAAQPTGPERRPALQGARDTVSAVRIAAAYGMITSTYRSVAHNRAVGGVPNSHHLAGHAIDVVRKPGVTHSQIAAAFRKAGYNVIESLDEGDHSHFAFDLSVSATQMRKPASAGRVPPRPTLVLADQHGTLLVDLDEASAAFRN